MKAGRELPLDHNMSQLAAILDEETMRAALQQALGGRARSRDAGDIRNCRIEWIKYKPGKNCTVCYRLFIDDDSNPDFKREQILYGRIYADGSARSRLFSAPRAGWVQPKFGSPMIHLAELDMLAWLFPNDRKLSGLPHLIDRDCLMKVLLPEAVSAAIGAAWRIEDVEPDLVHYVPEHTCTVKADLTLAHKLTDERHLLTLYGKTYYNRAGAASYRSMQELWQQVATDNAKFTVAKPCAYHPGYCVLWQTRVAGETLLQLPFAGPRFMAALPQAAAAIAALHQSRVHGSPTVTLPGWLEKLSQLRQTLPQILPSSAGRVQELIDRLSASAKELSEPVLATLHGDLHLGNILIDADQVGLIDLDSLSRGPALCDIGSCIAALIYQGLMQRIAPPRMNEIIGRFCRHYRDQVPWQVELNDLCWYTAAALVHERAFRSFSRLKLGRIEGLEELLEQAYQIGVMKIQPMEWLKRDPQ